MKLRLPLFLLASIFSLYSAVAQTTPPVDATAITNFEQLSYLLDKDYSYTNPHFTSFLDKVLSLEWDGANQFALSFTKQTGDSSQPFFLLAANKTKTSDLSATTSLAFKALSGLEFRNAGGTGSAIVLYDGMGTGETSLLFTNIRGNIVIDGFASGKTMANGSSSNHGAVLVRSQYGKATISFNDIIGDITVSNNAANSSNGNGALAVWSDYATGSAYMDFSNIKGNILIKNNTTTNVAGGLYISAMKGKSLLNFSKIEGGITLSGNSAYYGGGMYMEGSITDGSIGGIINYSKITGDVLFSKNEASSGGGIMLTAVNASLTVTDITGNVTFDGNKALGKGEPGMGGAIVLEYANQSNFSGDAKIEFSKITGDVLFRNNIALDTGAGAFGGGIFTLLGSGGEGLLTLVLSADYGNIMFEGNKAADTANAVYLGGNSSLDFRAQTSRTLAFYDPLVTETGRVSSLHLNKDSGGLTYGGTVLFSGEKITEASLGGDAGTLAARLLASKVTNINGETHLYNGTLLIKEGAVLKTETATVDKTASVSSSSGGSLVMTGKAGTVASMVVSSGAQVNASLKFEGLDSLLTLQGSVGDAKSILKGTFSGLSHVKVTGGDFERRNSFGDLKTCNIVDGILSVDLLKSESFVYGGGYFNLIMSGDALGANQSATIVDVGTLSGALADRLLGGTGKILDAGVSFDLDNYGPDLVGKSFDLVKIGGILQQYDSFLLEGTSCSANSGWLTYTKEGLSFKYSFDGGTVLIGDQVKDIIASEDPLPPGEGGEHSTVEKVTTKGDVIVSAQDPTGLDFESNKGVTKNIGTDLTMTGSLTAVQDSLWIVTTKYLLDGTIDMVTERPLSEDLVHLIVGEDVSLAQADIAQPGSISNIGSTTIKKGMTLTLDNTSLNSSLSFDALEGSSLIATGAASQIVIGGGEIDTEGFYTVIASVVSTSLIEGSEISLKDGASIQLSKVTDVQGTKLDTVLVIKDSKVSLGSSENDLGAALLADEGTHLWIQDSTVKGSGMLDNANFLGGSLCAGSSPGVIALNNITTSSSAQGAMTFQAQICNFGNNIVLDGMNNTTDSVSGNISQFDITGNVTLGRGTVFEIVLWNNAGADAFDSKTLEQGAKFQFFTFNGGSITGEFAGLLNAPTLADGLMWDISQLTTGGFAQVIWSAIADGSRIANTLWTSGQTVSNISTEAVKHVGEAVTGKTSIWLSSLNDFSRASSEGKSTGYDFNTQGYSVGAQRGIEGGHVIGLAFGNSYGTHTPLEGSRHASAGKIKQDAVMGTVYGRIMLSNAAARDNIWSIDAYAGYGEVSNKSTRTVKFDSSTASAKWSDMIKTVGVQGNYATKLNEKTILTPFAGLDFIYGEQDDFTEEAKSVKASYKNGAYYNLRASLGASISHVLEFSNGMALIPSLSASYGYDVCRMNPHTDVSEAGGDYRAYGVSPGRNSFQITPALSWKISNAWSASTNYTLRTRSGLTDQSVNASVGYSF